MKQEEIRPKVVLTDAIHPDAHAALAEEAEILMLDPALSPEAANEALRTLVSDAQGLIVRRRLPDDLFEGPHALLGVVRHGVGLDFIPVDSATASGLPVANTPEVNANAVAEYAVTAMLDAARRFRQFNRAVHDGSWDVRKSAGAQTFELRGRTLGIVGYGAIGKRLAEIAMAGFGMRVAACTRNSARLPGSISALSLKELFHTSDFIVLACPLTAETRGMINSSVLEHARSGLVLVNVSRGPVINEQDLIKAIDSGRLGSVALDVFETQPLPMDSPLRAYPQVSLTPHLAGMTGDAERAMGMMAVQTQLALIRGERPSNIVNPDYQKAKETL